MSTSKSYIEFDENYQAYSVAAHGMADARGIPCVTVRGSFNGRFFVLEGTSCACMTSAG